MTASHQHANGFTLLEMLLSMAIIAILAGLSVPVYQSFQVKNDVDVATNTVVQSMRRAQFLSQAASGDETWGVYVQPGSITLFQGPDYMNRDDAYDEVFDLPYSIDPTGLQEVVFNKLTGTPQSQGTLMLSSSAHTVTITINEQGILEY